MINGPLTGLASITSRVFSLMATMTQLLISLETRQNPFVDLSAKLGTAAANRERLREVPRVPGHDLVLHLGVGHVTS